MLGLDLFGEDIFGVGGVLEFFSLVFLGGLFVFRIVVFGVRVVGGVDICG